MVATSLPAQFNDNIIFTSSTCSGSRYGLREWQANSDPVQFHNNLLFDAPDGLFHNEFTTLVNDTGTLGTLHPEFDVVASCATSSCSSGNVSTGGGTAAVFASYSDTNLMRIIKAGGPADINNPGGGYSAGDIGADAATGGVQ